MIAFFRAWWQARQRNADLRLLWPACKANTADLERARWVFAQHCAGDRAWLALDGEHVAAVIQALE